MQEQITFGRISVIYVGDFDAAAIVRNFLITFECNKQCNI